MKRIASFTGQDKLESPVVLAEADSFMKPIAKIYKKLSEVPEIIMSFFKIGSSS